MKNSTHFYRYLLINLLLLSSLQAKAQFDQKKFDKESFLIGTLSEYMGYQRTFTNKDDFYYQRVDIMSQQELKRAIFIDSMFHLNYADITIVNNGAPQGIKIYSPSLTKKIDEYYNYKPTDIRTMPGDTVYGGNIIKERFDTEKQKNSFLLGAALRYGGDQSRANSIIQSLKNDKLLAGDQEHEDVAYAFSMSNAPTKAQICVDFLKDLGCEDVEFVSRNTIPAGNFVVFTPNSAMLEIINEAERLRQHIEKIDTSHIEFTADGTKFIWKEPAVPSFQ